MPGNLASATVSPATTVIPRALYLSFVRTESYPLISTQYHDGTLERSLITDTVNAPRSCRTWKLSQRISTAALATLRTFWETTVQGGAKPAYYYDPFDAIGAIGSNFDATGVSTDGRVTVFFRGNWAEQTDMGRSVVPELFLVEVA